jgi:DNA polymerase-3 subunit delta
LGLVSKISRYYLFYGPDEYAKSIKIKSLKNLVIEKGFEEFDYNVFEGRGLDGAELINIASSPPFGSPIRIVVLRNIEKVSPKGLKMLESFIASIPKHTTLIVTAGKIDKRKSIFKMLYKNRNACVNFKMPNPAAAVEHVMETAAEKNYKIAPETAAYLVESIGSDIGYLDRELDKLVLYAGPDSPIEKDDIVQVSGAGVSGTAPGIPEKILDGDIGGALILLQNLLSTKKSEGSILFIIKDYFLAINKIKASKGVPSAFAGKKYGYLPKTVEILNQAARKIPAERIINCLHCIYECEINLKSAGLKNHIILADLVARLGIEIQGE